MAEGTKCSICLDLLCFPVSTHCGHNFCKECIEKVIHNSICGIKCPYCRTNIPRRIQINRLLEALIEQCYPKQYARRMQESELPKPVSTLKLVLNTGSKLTRVLFFLLLPLVFSLIVARNLKKIPKKLLAIISWLIKVNLYPTSYIWQLVWTITHIIFKYIETTDIISGITL